MPGAGEASVTGYSTHEVSEVLHLSPSTILTWTALEDRGRSPAALEAYEAALRLDPELAVAHFNASRLYEAQGREVDALAHLAAYKRILDQGGTVA